MAKQRGEQDQLIGQLPGTGGDFIDDNDVEGHRVAKDGEPDGIRSRDDDGIRSRDDDVEGHRLVRAADGEPDGFRVRDGEPDGLYRGGPTTQGEVIRRGPGDNPHGER